ncbi:MAG: hypothetical protein HYY52_06750 [Candidatus Melainabacteria bacterium]|nr:hypothetical protein [Candidatus Melainabacteria bacterium]
MQFNNTKIHPYPKLETESCLKLSLFGLDKNTISHASIGTITWSSLMGFKLTIGFCVLLGDKSAFYIIYPNSDIMYEIPLTTTKCNYGGKRYWFVCPLCKNRFGVLYKASHSNYFACRYCHNLTYKSCKLSGHNKKYGNYMPAFQLMEEWNSIKRFFYKGEFTKRYKKFLEKCEKTKSAMASNIERLRKELSYSKSSRNRPTGLSYKIS